jgi:hypothetical protein
MKVDGKGNLWIAEQYEPGLKVFDGLKWDTHFEEENNYVYLHRS